MLRHLMRRVNWCVRSKLTRAMSSTSGLLSHVVGSTDVPLLSDTIPSALARAVQLHDANEALVVPHQSVRYTYEELSRKVDELASALLALGLRAGDRVGVWAPNCAEWTLTQFATARIGLILVNINPAYRLNELSYALSLVQCRALILASSFKSSNYIEMINELLPELSQSAGPGTLRSSKLPSLQFIVRLGETRSAGMYNFDELLRSTSVDERRRRQLDTITAALSPHDAINIQFTSGTTGHPKGATLTHHNIVNNGYFVARAQQFSAVDRVCIAVPLYHCFGLVMGNVAAITHGATMVYPCESFEPVAVLATVAKERCTSLYGVPTMFIAELSSPHFASFDLRSLRTGIMAGAPCPIQTMRDVAAKMHMKDVTICYGMTETSPVSFQTASGDPLEKRVATVGRVHPHVECKVIGTSGSVVPRGQPGELW